MRDIFVGTVANGLLQVHSKRRQYNIRKLYPKLALHTVILNWI